MKIKSIRFYQAVTLCQQTITMAGEPGIKVNGFSKSNLSLVPGIGVRVDGTKGIISDSIIVSLNNISYMQVEDDAPPAEAVALKVTKQKA